MTKLPFNKKKTHIAFSCQKLAGKETQFQSQWLMKLIQSCNSNTQAINYRVSRLK